MVIYVLKSAVAREVAQCVGACTTGRRSKKPALRDSSKFSDFLEAVG